MEVNAERDCSVLGGLFQTIINDMKGAVPVWEDFTTKASKLHTQLKTTSIAVSAFLEAFQRIADIATNSRGATKDLGVTLTRMCLKHKTIENKLKSFTNAMMECLVVPLQERMEEWKKITTQLDKEHAKDYKKARQDIKKKASDTMRLQKKARKGKPDIQYRLDSAMHDVNDMYLLLEEQEKNAVRGGMIEERSRFCTLVTCFKPVVEEEISMLSDMARLESVLGELLEQGKDPYVLPQSSEQVILDVKNQDIKWSYQTPPGSPSQSSGSRKSSMCSLSSMTSSDSRSSSSTNSHSPGTNFIRHRSMSQPNNAYRLSSVSSQDSGFTSQDTLFTMQPGTPPQTVPEETSQQRLLHSASAPYELEHQSSSECSTPSSPTPPPSSSQFALPPSQAAHGFAPPPPSWLVNFTQPEKVQRPKSIPTPVSAPSSRPPAVADKPLVSPKPKSSDPKNRDLPLVPDFNTPQSNQIVPRPMCTTSGQTGSNADIYRQRSATLPARRHTHGSMPSALFSRDYDGTTASQGSSSICSGYSSQPNAGAYTDDMISSKEKQHQSVDGSTENLNDTEKLTSFQSNTTESMYTTTPNQSPTRRPMSMACIPTSSFSDSGTRNTATTPVGPLRKSKPPPPIRRTPSGGSLAGMCASGEMQPSLTSPGLAGKAEGEDGSSDVFKRPYTPGRVRSRSTVQVPYGSDLQQPEAQPQGRVHRSHSLKLTGDIMVGDVARLSLMESLNAKLAQRGQAPSIQNSAPRQQMPVDQQQSVYQQPTAQQFQQQQQYRQQQQQQADLYQYQQQQQQQQHFQHNQHQEPPQQYTHSQSMYMYKQPSPSQQVDPTQNHMPGSQSTSQSFQQRQLQVQQQLQQKIQQGVSMQASGYNTQNYGQPQNVIQQMQMRQAQAGQSGAQQPQQQVYQQHMQQQQPASNQEIGPQSDSESSDSDCGVGIMSEIKLGVKLRRTVSNDRSAPRI